MQHVLLAMGLLRKGNCADRPVCWYFSARWRPETANQRQGRACGGMAAAGCKIWALRRPRLCARMCTAGRAPSPAEGVGAGLERAWQAPALHQGYGGEAGVIARARCAKASVQTRLARREDSTALRRTLWPGRAEGPGCARLRCAGARGRQWPRRERARRRASVRRAAAGRRR